MISVARYKEIMENNGFTVDKDFIYGYIKNTVDQVSCLYGSQFVSLYNNFVINGDKIETYYMEEGDTINVYNEEDLEREVGKMAEKIKELKIQQKLEKLKKDF
jgi:hypothetical protein